MYWLKKVNEHSLHSPFVFSLYKDCLKNHHVLPDLAEVEDVRQKMQKDDREFKGNAKGAGSSVGKNQNISRIANVGISSLNHSKLLRSLIERYQLVNILELGTSIGVNTLYLANAKGVDKIVTVDGDINLLTIAQENFELVQSHKIEAVCEDIDEFMLKSIKAGNEFDFIFIDANHKKDATLRYFEQFQKLGSERWIIIIDDINWSQGMSEAWNGIKEQSKGCLTIENYQFGIVFSANYPANGHYILDF